jgi:hypothetical protein
MKRLDLALELLPRLSRGLRRGCKEHHVVGIADQSRGAENFALRPAPLSVYLVQHDVRQERRDHAALGRSSVRVPHLTFVEYPGLEPRAEKTKNPQISDPSFHEFHQEPVVDGVEVRCKIDVDYVCLSGLDCLDDGSQR